jgi:hypothetical protein
MRQKMRPKKNSPNLSLPSPRFARSSTIQNLKSTFRLPYRRISDISESLESSDSTAHSLYLVSQFSNHSPKKLQFRGRVTCDRRRNGPSCERGSSRRRLGNVRMRLVEVRINKGWGFTRGRIVPPSHSIIPQCKRHSIEIGCQGQPTECASKIKPGE